MLGTCQLLVLLALACGETSGGLCDYWVSNRRDTDECFVYKFVAEQLSFVDAELNCLAQNANLMSIHSEAEQNFTLGLVQNCATKQTGHLAWTGMSDKQREGVFLWTDGTQPNFFKWGPGEPDNHRGKERCVLTNWVRHGSDLPGLWNDIHCDHIFSSVCKARTTCG